MMTSAQDHEDWRLAVSAYADGECEPELRAQVEAHLADCDACRQWLAQVTEDRRRYVGALEASAHGVDLTDRVMAGVSGVPAPQKREAYPPVGLAPQGAALAVSRLRMRLLEALVGVAILAVLAAVMLPTFARSREKARQVSCQSNLKQIALAMQMYAQDYQGRLPDALRWKEQLLPYTRNEALYGCPGGEGAGPGPYAMNARYSGATLADIPHPETAILAYDADEAGRPVARHNGGTDCAFADGHVKWVQGVPDIGALTSMVAPPASGYGLADRLKLAYEATAELWVKSIHQAVLMAETIAAQHGGFVLVSSTQAVQEPFSAQIVCRVPTREITATINALGALGWVARREIHGEDLTRQYLDKERQVQVEQHRQERLGQVVQRASQMEHVVPAEQNLSQSEAAETTAHSELYQVQDRTTLATITATLLQRSWEKPEPPSLATSLAAALAALRATGVALARGGIWALLFIWAWGPVVWVAARALRRRGRGKTG